MYRQAMGLRHFSVRVFTCKRQNAERYPFPSDAITFLPQPSSKPRNLIGRLGRRISNYRLGFSAAELGGYRWWTHKLETTPPDIVFCQYGETGARLTKLARRYCIPVVTQFNGIDSSRQLRRLDYRLRLRSSLPKMAGCVAVASYQIDKLVALGLPKEHARLIPYGVPIDEFQLDAQMSEGPCRFLTVGRFVAKKAPELTIRAFARCVRGLPDCELRMIGDGPLRPECELLAIQLGISDQVSFLGAQPIDIVRQELAAAHIFIQHSMTAPNGDMEGWPVAVAEAAASSLPIVATRHAGIVDQVIEGKTGFLVDEGDWEAMGQHMVDLASNRSMRGEMGAASRAHISQFDLPNQIGKLESFLTECMKNNAS